MFPAGEVVGIVVNDCESDERAVAGDRASAPRDVRGL